MKKFSKFLLLIVPLVLLMFTSTVYADDDNEVEDEDGRFRYEEFVVPTQAQKYIKVRREEIKERIRETKATKAAELAEAKKTRLRAYWGRLQDRLLALIDREEKLIERMNSRVLKIEGDDSSVDLSEVKSGLADNQEKLDKAKADLQAAVDSFEEVLSSNDPKEAFKGVRDTVYDIRRTILEVHTSLAQLIGNLRGLKVGQMEDNN